MRNLPCNIHGLIFCGMLLGIEKIKPGHCGANTITHSKNITRNLLLKVVDTETLKHTVKYTIWVKVISNSVIEKWLIIAFMLAGILMKMFTFS